MLITSLAGHIDDLSPSQRDKLTIDDVVFDNESRLKRVQRVTTTGGTEIALRLGHDVHELHDGDLLALTASTAIVARIAPTDVLVITPRSITEALFVAHSLGNRHLQAQFFDATSSFGAEVMVVRYDHTVEHFLDHHSVPYTRGEHVMPEAFRHAEHTH